MKNLLPPIFFLSVTEPLDALRRLARLQLAMVEATREATGQALDLWQAAAQRQVSAADRLAGRSS